MVSAHTGGQCHAYERVWFDDLFFKLATDRKICSMVLIYRWLSEAVKWLKTSKMAYFMIYSEFGGSICAKTRGIVSSLPLRHSDSTNNHYNRKPVKGFTLKNCLNFANNRLYIFLKQNYICCDTYWILLSWQKLCNWRWSEKDKASK